MQSKYFFYKWSVHIDIVCEKREKRAAILIDGEEWRELAIGAARPFSQWEGCLSIEDANEVERRIAFRRACRLLAIRSRLSSEVRDRLAKEGLSQAAIDHAVARCTKLGYLDDDAEEERRLEREIAKGKGPFVIRQLGFSEGDIARLFPEERQMSVIERLAEKKKSLPRQKLAQFLQRRGFPLSLILDTLGDR